jgi:glutaredoxin
MPKKILIILIIILAALVGFLIWGGIWSSGRTNPKLEAFAKCLAEKNITMYGTPWCEWCQKEEALFGKSFSLVPYVDCSRNPQECITRGINATPTWIFSDGRKVEGYQTLEQLSQESGCELPK